MSAAGAQKKKNNIPGGVNLLADLGGRCLIIGAEFDSKGCWRGEYLKSSFQVTGLFSIYYWQPDCFMATR